MSFHHDHVVTDLAARYADVVEAVEASEGWVTSVRASSPPLTLLGSLDGGATVRVPTLAEMVRIKAYLVVQRNAVRDYLDTVALVDRLGSPAWVDVLVGLDGYYSDRSGESDSVLTSLVVKLSEPSPRDVRATANSPRTKGSSRDGTTGMPWWRTVPAWPTRSSPGASRGPSHDPDLSQPRRGR